MSTLTFVAQWEQFSEYRCGDNTSVYLEHGQVMTPYQFRYDRWDVNEFWGEMGGDRNAFIEFLRATLVDDYADDIHWCNECEQIDHLEDGSIVRGGTFVCDECLSDYFYCSKCEEFVPEGETTCTLYTDSDDVKVCDSCLRRDYSWCEYCDGYYRDNEGFNHDHDEDEDDDENECECEPPTYALAVRNDGGPPLASNDVITVSLPAGTIDSEGMDRIYDFVSNGFSWKAAELVSVVGPVWQQKDGNFTKRLARLAWNRHQLKIPPEILSQIGNIARAHSISIDYRLAVTRALNMHPEEFGHSGSCWWGDYTPSRCALKHNGGFGLRSFGDYGEVAGRSWVIPLRTTNIHGTERLVPTFDAMHADAFIVFNGYGNLGGYSAARIVSHMTGMTYRKVGFDCDPMYINNDNGYLVAPEEIATKYTDGHLSLNVETHSDLYYREQRANQALSVQVQELQELLEPVNA